MKSNKQIDDYYWNKLRQRIKENGTPGTLNIKMSKHSLDYDRIRQCSQKCENSPIPINYQYIRILVWDDTQTIGAWRFKISMCCLA